MFIHAFLANLLDRNLIVKVLYIVLLWLATPFREGEFIHTLDYIFVVIIIIHDHYHLHVYVSRLMTIRDP